MAYSIDPISANCYPGTTVLINKFDILDEETLSEVEGTLTAAKSAQWLNAPEKDTFDFAHYKAIHRFLFADLCSTNMLHPFREGNGRTQRVFLSQLAQNAGYMLNFAKIDGDLLMIATIQSAQGVTDLLRSLLAGAIKQISPLIQI